MKKKGGKVSSIDRPKKQNTKGKKVEFDGTEDFDDEIDVFEKQRNKAMIPLDEDVEENEEDEEEEVFDVDVPSSDEQEEDDDEDDFDDDEDILGQGKPKEKSEKAWGKGKRAYYDGDVTDEEFGSSDNEVLREEEEEAKRIQKQKLQSLKEEDFGSKDLEDSFGSILKKGGQKKKDTKTKEKPQEVEKEKESKNSEKVIERIEKDASKLSKEELMEIILNDSPELIELLAELKEKVADVKNNLEPLLEKVKSGELKKTEGISFLELKYQLLLNYCTNISFYMLLKSSGKKVKDHPVVEQLVELRAALEKIKPIETKLKYQIDKLVRIANMGSLSKDDPLRFKPNPADLMKSGEEEEEEDDKGLYKIPKIAPAKFDEDTSKEAKLKKKELLKLQKERKSRIFGDLQEEFSEKPLEISDKTEKEDEAERMRREFEEEYMMRTTLSKSDKKKAKKAKFVNELDNLEDFGNLGKLMEEEEEEEETTLKRKAPKKSKNNDLLDSMKDFGQEEDIMEEDDFYEKVKSMKDQKKKDKLKAKQEEEEEWTGFGEEGEDENDGRRVATNQILKNRGLTPKRNKEIKNPRVKRRMKFEKASKKLKHIVPQAKSKGQPYQGELTGIKPNLSKSVRIK